MKSTETFKKTISAHLDKVASNDSAFAEKLTADGKNIDDCITYILNQVKKSGFHGFADEEIYGMALHYYDEEKVEVGKPIDNANVVVNHAVDLTEEEKAQAKQKAIDDLISEERAKLLKKDKKKVEQTIEQTSLF